MKLRGEDMVLFRLVGGDWKAIALSTNCEMDVTADVVEVGTPLTGRSKRMRPERMRWTLTSDHVFAIDEAAWLGAVESDEPMRVLMGVRRNEHVSKPIVIQGDVLAMRVQSGAGKGEKVHWTAEFVGDGAPLFADLEWILADGVWNMQGEIWKDFGEWLMGVEL